MFERKMIDLSQLLLSKNNPRLIPVESQQEAIREMVRNQENKLFNLASDIVENGLNPADSVYVMKEGNDYIVKEGNRRIVAIKLLETPNIIEDINPKLYKKIKKLNDKYVNNPISEVYCTIFTDPDMCNHWISIKHNGENQGRGTVSWDAEQKQRFDDLTKKTVSKEIQIFDFYINHDTTNSINRDEVKLSTLKRLIDDPDVREAIGLHVEKGRLVSSYPVQVMLDLIYHVLKDVSDSGFNVKEVYHKSDRIKYVERLIEKCHLDKNKKLSMPYSLDNPSESKPNAPMTTQNQPKIKTNNRLPATNIRSSLIPKSYKLYIDDQRTVNLFQELKKASIEDYPNLIALGLRMFIEFSVGHYLAMQPNLKLKDDKLKTKLKHVVKDMKESRFEESVIAAIEVEIENKNSLICVNTLHQFVHNKNMNPIPTDLKTIWDNFEKVISFIWDIDK